MKYTFFVYFDGHRSVHEAEYKLNDFFAALTDGKYEGYVVRRDSVRTLVVEDCDDQAILHEIIGAVGYAPGNSTIIRAKVSEDDAKMNTLMLELEEVGLTGVTLDYDPFDGGVWLIPGIQPGGLVEYQVSNGPPSARGKSSEYYAYSHAKRIFDAIAENGWGTDLSKVLETADTH